MRYLIIAILALTACGIDPTTGPGEPPHLSVSSLLLPSAAPGDVATAEVDVTPADAILGVSIEGGSPYVSVWSEGGRVILEVAPESLQMGCDGEVLATVGAGWIVECGALVVEVASGELRADLQAFQAFQAFSRP
jgi:hypothetical protein